MNDACGALRPQPNIVIIYTDQQRYDTLGSSGNRLIQTPNLDRLADQGACFSRAYVTCPICVPSRVSLWTGRYNHTNLSYNNNRLMSPREADFAMAFKTAGYHTALIGKNHCFPYDRTHETFETFLPAGHAGFAPALNPAGQRNLDVRAGKMTVPFAPDPVDPEENPTAQIVREAMRFVEEKRDGPFLLWLSIPDPHPPYMVAEPWASMYADVAMPPPAWREGEMADKPYRQRLLVEWDRFSRDYPGDDVLKLRRIYWGMVSCIDEHVGRLLTALERTGIDGNTIVAFTSDHGDYMGDHRMVRKSVNLYEALVHVPLIIKGPGVPARSSSAMVENVDIMPTLAEMAGLDMPEGVQGSSFAGVLRAESAAHRDHVCLEHGNPGPVLRPGDISPADYDRLRFSEHHLGREVSSGPVKGVRTDRWKYCMTPGDVDELYDLINDPDELVNLARDPSHAKVCADHQRMILEWLVATEESPFAGVVANKEKTG